jgi:enolase 1/2/3
LPVIEQFTGREILDSRGRPTVEATCTLSGGVRAAASIPSGISVGAAEALELRDGDPRRYHGLGCRHAAANINGPIHGATTGRQFAEQAEFDHLLISLDGTPAKSRLGSNAILAASIAFARACALEAGIPLWQRFSELVGSRPVALPRLTINLLSGGKHAGQQVAIQDVLIVPAEATSIDASLAVAYDVYQAAARLTFERYGMRLLRADEGGLGPPCRSAEEMIETALMAIQAAGYEGGAEVALALDVAATHFYSDGRYRIGSETLSSQAMIARIRRWVRDYPIVSVEDGLAEEDWKSWPRLREAIERDALVLGDDLLCTNPERIRRAIAERACNALLLKVNQVGTLTEAADALRLARGAGWMVTISVRSGETEDNWAADLATGWCADQFKNGSITQSERLAKYNRLLLIEQQTKMGVTEWPGSSRRQGKSTKPLAHG